MAFAKKPAKKGDPRMFYGLTNKIVGQMVNRSLLSQDEKGNVISDDKKVDER